MEEVRVVDLSAPSKPVVKETPKKDKKDDLAFLDALTGDTSGKKKKKKKAGAKKAVEPEAVVETKPDVLDSAAPDAATMQAARAKLAAKAKAGNKKKARGDGVLGQAKAEAQVRNQVSKKAEKGYER